MSKIRWFGSGFFYGHFVKKIDEERSMYRVYLVTNKHVLERLDKVFFRINPQDEEPAKDYELDLTDGQGNLLWEGHRLKKVDVAVIPVNYQLFKDQKMAVEYFRSNSNALDMKGLKNAGAFEGDGAYLLGFPMGLVGERRSSVIVRAGALARIRDSYHRATEPFLVDVLAFPGNSGGPVVVKPEIHSVGGTKNIVTASLIGIVASYVPYQDVSYSLQTQQPTITISQNSGLAHVFSIDCIRQTIKQYEHRDKKHKKEIQPKKSDKPSEEPVRTNLEPLKPGIDKL